MTENPEEREQQADESKDDGPKVHTSAEEGHPAGEGERTDRDIGGPTSPEDAPEEDVTGGAPGRKPGGGFEPHE